MGQALLKYSYPSPIVKTPHFLSLLVTCLDYTKKRILHIFITFYIILKLLENSQKQAFDLSTNYTHVIHI